MEIDVMEWVQTKNGGYFKHTIEEREFPESEGRHSPLCVYCGMKSYPECREWCPQMGYAAEAERNKKQKNK